MENRRPVWGDIAGAVLCLCALVNFLALKPVGYFSWYLPIFGTLIPLAALPLLWGSSMLLSAASLGVYVSCIRQQGLRWRALAAAAITLDTVLLILYANLIVAMVWSTEESGALWERVFEWIYMPPSDIPRLP